MRCWAHRCIVSCICDFNLFRHSESLSNSRSIIYMQVYCNEFHICVQYVICRCTSIESSWLLIMENNLFRNTVISFSICFECDNAVVLLRESTMYVRFYIMTIFSDCFHSLTISICKVLLQEMTYIPCFALFYIPYSVFFLFILKPDNQFFLISPCILH